MDILFLDANIFFAASSSPTGGSAFLFQMARHKKASMISSRYALNEARVNIERKCQEKELVTFYSLISVLDSVDAKNVTTHERRQLKHLIVEKDLPILASALRLHADFLITLDKKDFMTEKLGAAKLPITIKSPGDCLRNFEEK